MPHKITVLADLHLLPETQAGIQKLFGDELTFPGDSPTADQLVSRTGNAEIVLVSPGTQLGAEYFDSCPSVEHVIVCGTSTVNIDHAAAKNHDVQIHNITHYGDDVAAETVFERLQALISSGKTRLQDMATSSVGIVGLGAVGRAAAAQAHALEMDVAYYSPTKKDVDSITYKSLPELLSLSDIVVLCGPGNKQVLGQAEFECIKPQSVLVQLSQGDVADIDALKQWAMQEGNFVLLDGATGTKTKQVLKDMANVLILPDHSGYSQKSRQLLGVKLIDTLNQILLS